MRKKKYKNLPIEYYIAAIFGMFIGSKVPSYLHITSKFFIACSSFFFGSFNVMYVSWFKAFGKELLNKDDENKL